VIESWSFAAFIADYSCVGFTTVDRQKKNLIGKTF